MNRESINKLFIVALFFMAFSFVEATVVVLIIVGGILS